MARHIWRHLYYDIVNAVDTCVTKVGSDVDDWQVRTMLYFLKRKMELVLRVYTNVPFDGILGIQAIALIYKQVNW